MVCIIIQASNIILVIVNWKFTSLFSLEYDYFRHMKTSYNHIYRKNDANSFRLVTTVL